MYEVEDQSHLPTLPRKGGYAWLLKVHRTQGWECVEIDTDTWQWLPRLRKFHHRPGVNGHTARSSNLAKVNDQNAGFIILDDPAIVKRYRKVLRALPGPAGARAYWHSWDEPLVSGRSVMRKRDKAAALAFRIWLVESGTVPLPDEVHLRTAIDTLRKRVGRATKAAGSNPHLTAKMESEARRLHAAEQACATGKWKKPGRKKASA